MKHLRFEDKAKMRECRLNKMFKEIESMLDCIRDYNTITRLNQAGMLESRNIENQVEIWN